MKTRDGSLAAARAENRARLARADAERAQAEAQATYFRGVNSSIPNMLPPNGGGITNRTDTPYSLVDTDIGNYRWQNPYELWEERARSRQLENTNWLAAATMDRSIERVLGTLIQIKPTTASDDFNAEVNKWLKSYWYTAQCDIRNLFSLSQFFHLLFRAKMRDGDVGCVLTEDAQHNPKLQLIEAQRIKTPTNGQKPIAGNQIVDGVEMDANGAPVAYWVSYRNFGQPEKFIRVDARDFIYLFRTTRYSNVRGEPAFRGGYWLFDQVIGLIEAIVISWRVGASSAMFMNRESPGTAAAPNAFGGQLPNRSPGVLLNGQQAAVIPISPGAINVMGIGEKMTAFQPSQPTQSFPDAIDTFARFVGIRFGLTLEDILLNFAKVNYSSSKAAKSASKLATAIEQDNFASMVISRSYQWALSKAVKNGKFKTAAPESFWDHTWIPPVWGSVEPLKDIQYAERAVALGVDARSYLAAENGYDFDDLCERNGEDQKKMAAAGLTTAIAVGTTGKLQLETEADKTISTDPNESNPQGPGIT